MQANESKTASESIVETAPEERPEARPSGLPRGRLSGPASGFWPPPWWSRSFWFIRPVWQGGLLWDDDRQLTFRPAVLARTVSHLVRRAVDVAVLSPLAHLLLAAVQALGRRHAGLPPDEHPAARHGRVLAAQVLRRLAIPGACLAAAIFALHPVQVESVAWIAEQKNTLSAVFYLAAALVYLRFDQTRKLNYYAAAAAFFAAALLSKTVTATLPGGLLVVLWWQRGRLSWRATCCRCCRSLLWGRAGACSRPGGNCESTGVRVRASSSLAWNGS